MIVDRTTSEFEQYLELYEKAPQKFGLGDKLVMIESTNIKDPSIAGTTRLR